MLIFFFYVELVKAINVGIKEQNIWDVKMEKTNMSQYICQSCHGYDKNKKFKFQYLSSQVAPEEK